MSFALLTHRFHPHPSYGYVNLQFRDLFYIYICRKFSKFWLPLIPLENTCFHARLAQLSPACPERRSPGMRLLLTVLPQIGVNPHRDYGHIRGSRAANARTWAILHTFGRQFRTEFRVIKGTAAGGGIVGLIDRKFGLVVAASGNGSPLLSADVTGFNCLSYER